MMAGEGYELDFRAVGEGERSGDTRRRGCEVCATQGTSIRFKYNAPPRDGWTPFEPLPFYDEVED